MCVATFRFTNRVTFYGVIIVPITVSLGRSSMFEVSTSGSMKISE